MDEKDARLTYETYWKKTDFSIKSKRGKSMMHSSAWRPLMPASKKDAKMLEWKLKGNTKLQVMFGTGKKADSKDAKLYHMTQMMEVVLDDAAAYVMSASAVGLAALTLF